MIINATRGLGVREIENWYRFIEQQFHIVHPINGELRDLCNAKENYNEPVYSWYNLKEAFSYNLPSWSVKRLEEKYGFKASTALDPFVGGGTSLISLRKKGIESFGIEYNPFIAWVAKTKATWHEGVIEELLYATSNIKFSAANARVVLPELSTFKNPAYFDQIEVKKLISVLNQIEVLNISDQSKSILKLGVASAIEDISNLKKDGRALRFIPDKKKKASAVVRSKWNSAIFQLHDIKNSWDDRSPVHVYNGSSIDFSELQSLTNSTVCQLMLPKDMIIYSPPYLNNFDYSEVYKLELWLLNFISDYDKWRELRRGTVRSHHSVRFKKTTSLETSSKTKSLYEKINALASSRLLEDRRKTNMPEVIKGYFDDMFSSLQHQYSLLSSGGYLVYNVANSRHGDLPIATDVILAEIAMAIGFKPLELVVLHNRNGRTSKNHYLRESIVIMRK